MTATLEAISKDITAGRYEAADEALGAAVATDENRSELLFLRGLLQEVSYERPQALESYEKVLEGDADHREALFRAALLADQAGNDEAAIALYERCVATSPAPSNALVNLALLYEESGRVEEAEELLRAVLAEFPNHKRAARFLRSVQASYFSMLDEKTQRDRDGVGVDLDVSVSDFELSVRSRNCLRQMNIRTLGDLLRITEAELLAYKNFGETSLNEIKAMLGQRGMCLGQELQPSETDPLPDTLPPAGDVPVNLNRPVSELELSVRARKCLQLLGITTLGELVMRSEGELMSTKNFGQTSLFEIRRQLVELGLSLRE